MKIKKNNINILFIGTNEFALYHLKKIIKYSEFKILKIITKKKDIKSKNSIYKIAKKYKINISYINTIKKLNKIKKELLNLNIDIAIIASYGLIIPKNIFNISKFGFLNIHSSLLPKWKGPAPIQRSILYGDKITGFTFIKINKLVDSGKIIYQKKIKIKNKDNYNSIYKKIKKKSSNKLPKIIKKIFFNKIKLINQNKKYTTYAKKILKKEGLIIWKKNNANIIEKKFKAFIKWPKTFFYYKNYIIFIWSLKIDKKYFYKNKPGTILIYKNNELKISTKTFPIIINKLQLNNNKIISVLDLINSKPNFFIEGKILN